MSRWFAVAFWYDTRARNSIFTVKLTKKKGDCSFEKKILNYLPFLIVFKIKKKKEKVKSNQSLVWFYAHYMYKKKVMEKGMGEKGKS